MVTAIPRQSLRGWGVSLAWEANRIYGSPKSAAEIPDPAEQARFMDLLYGDPARGPGLGLNVARYNIGGGSNRGNIACNGPPKHGLRPSADMEGFLPGPNKPFDWSRDASQRRMLQEAKRRGATIFEAFSNSAPWWMTVSGCVAGAMQAGENNLRPEAVPAFAAYLTAVARHFAAAEAVTFESVSPVNEPDGTWWVAGNEQEGSFATLTMQEAIITALARDLAGGATIVSGTEPNSLDKMTGWLAEMDAASLAALGRINVHQYQPGDPAALHRKAAALGKPVWASEVGCCFAFDHRTEWDGALFMAQSIQQALTDLGAAVWCFWQPDWGVIDFSTGHPRPLPQYYAIAQYTRFIRPGFRVLDSRGDGLVAALSPDGRRLVLVAINHRATSMREDIDISALGRSWQQVRIYRADAATAANPVPSHASVTTDGHLLDNEPAASISTYVIDAG